MKLRGQLILIGICLLLLAGAVGAEDYKNWIPVLPDTVGGMAGAGKPDGMNMESDGQKWCMLHQQYGGNQSEKQVDLTLVWGGAAPFMANFQMMSKFEMETEDQITKTIKVSEYKGVLNLEKPDKRGTLMVALSKELMIVMELVPATKAGDLIKLVEELPLDKFVSQAK